MGAAGEFRDGLIRHGLLIPTGVDGVYGRSAEFEDTVERLDAMVSELCRPDAPTVMRFPPVLNRAHIEKSGYLKSFPQLLGSVHSFAGNDAAHRALLHAVESGEDWSAGLPQAGVTLTPAACYPVYPALAGTLPEEGRIADVLSYCFRHEPSGDPARMQAFRMRENVRLADPARVQAWRDVWFERATAYTGRLGLDARVEAANDPFFGRGGKLLAQSQRDLQLKFEVVTAIASAEQPTAIISLNYHQDHFGLVFGITTASGQPAHTACIGFGLERIALALFRSHGWSRECWPSGVRKALGL
jgi:seryl-tRNA synthetase